MKRTGHEKIGRATAGFTLIELMITVAIIAILLAIALPSYFDYVIRGNLVTATNQLSADRAQMEQYYQDARQYTDVTGFTSPCPSNYTPPNSYWTYNCTTLTDSTYVIQAQGTSGPVVGFIYSIDNDNNQISVQLPSTAWGANGTLHWIMKKGG